MISRLLNKPKKQYKIAAITHVDNTCRIQTVTEKQNKHYYDLIKELVWNGKNMSVFTMRNIVKKIRDKTFENIIIVIRQLFFLK